MRWIVGANNSESELSSKRTRCIGCLEYLATDIGFRFSDVLVGDLGPSEVCISLVERFPGLLLERGNGSALQPVCDILSRSEFIEIGGIGEF